MMPNAFDDQYIGCVAKMKKEMKKILAEELRNNRQLAEMWEQASQVWKGKSSTIKKKIDDNFGTAVVLYTMEGAYSIYRQLNGNISIAGKSRDFYMKNFHFKALHFYLSRALQVLRTGSEKTQVYRGMNTGAVSVAKEMRFGRFTSSSLSESIAQGYGENPFFRILTRFGVDISKFSVFEEQEVLIPIGEKFKLVKQNGTTYELESTGKLCSYFNCAYLGGEDQISMST
ncbi:ecto-ADP-ribosyltransferase 5-like [Mantella aurantiaca]